MRTIARIPRRLVAVATLALLAFAGSLVAADPQQQQPQQPQAARAPAPQPNFTGLVTNEDASDLRAVRFKYEAGARSYWHVHDGSQLLLLEQGRGRMQMQGGPIQDLVVGQPVVLPKGVAHWHGAAPDQGLTQIAVNVGGVRWMNAVTDQEYLGK